MVKSLDLEKAGMAGKPVRLTLPPPLAVVNRPAPPPPSPDAPKLDLRVPPPALTVEADAALAAIALERDTLIRLDVMSAEFIVTILKLDARDPRLGERIEEIRGMAGEDLAAARRLIAQICERQTGPLADGGVAASYPVIDSLTALRNVLDELNPAKLPDISASRRVFGIAIGDPVRAYFHRYQSRQSQLNWALNALRNAERDLAMDNEELERIKSSIPELLGRLREYVYVARKLESVLAERVAKMRATDPTRAQVFEDTAVVETRRKAAELTAWYRSLLQAYAYVDPVRHNNSELIRAFDRVITTTIAALRGAIATADDVTEQKISLKLVQGVNDAPIAARWTLSGPMDMARLQSAFDTIYHALEEIETWRKRSADSMTSSARVIQAPAPAR